MGRISKDVRDRFPELAGFINNFSDQLSLPQYNKVSYSMLTSPFSL